MYAVVAMAKTRCATVINGADQNTSNHPTYKGCRTRRYKNGVRKRSGVYGIPCRWSQTWRTPNRSKWLMRNVATRTVSQPVAYTLNKRRCPATLFTFQITRPIGSHFQNNRSNAKLENNT